MIDFLSRRYVLLKYSSSIAARILQCKATKGVRANGYLNYLIIVSLTKVTEVLKSKSTCDFTRQVVQPDLWLVYGVIINLRKFAAGVKCSEMRCPRAQFQSMGKTIGLKKYTEVQLLSTTIFWNINQSIKIVFWPVFFSIEYLKIFYYVDRDRIELSLIAPGPAGLDGNWWKGSISNIFNT